MWIAPCVGVHLICLTSSSPSIYPIVVSFLYYIVSSSLSCPIESCAVSWISSPDSGASTRPPYMHTHTALLAASLSVADHARATTDVTTSATTNVITTAMTDVTVTATALLTETASTTAMRATVAPEAGGIVTASAMAIDPETKTPTEYGVQRQRSGSGLRPRPPRCKRCGPPIPRH